MWCGWLLLAREGGANVVEVESGLGGNLGRTLSLLGQGQDAPEVVGVLAQRLGLVEALLVASPGPVDDLLHLGARDAEFEAEGAVAVAAVLGSSAQVSLDDGVPVDAVGGGSQIGGGVLADGGDGLGSLDGIGQARGER